MTEESDSKSKQDVTPLSAKELGKVRDAISSQFGHYLKPGETLTVDAERDNKQCWARLEIGTADDSFSLELEAAALPSDAPFDAKWDAEARFDDVVDMLDAQLADYFENERHALFHDDWRIYDFEGAVLRFRGRESRPALESLADAWLAANDPDLGEPN